MRRSCFPNSSSHQHGPPSLGRVRTPPRSPTSSLLCSPPTPSLPSAAAPVVPCQRPAPVRRLVLHRRTAPPPRTDATPEIFLPRLPVSRLCPEEKRGDPRCLGHPLHACRGQRPRRVRTAPRPSRGAVAIAFKLCETLGTRHLCQFRGYLPTAHTLAYLRIAGPVTGPGARLATGPGGLTPGRAGFAPAG